MSNKIEVALFDFDKTLIPVSSGTFLIQSFFKVKTYLMELRDTPLLSSARLQIWYC